VKLTVNFMQRSCGSAVTWRYKQRSLVDADAFRSCGSGLQLLLVGGLRCLLPWGCLASGLLVVVVGGVSQRLSGMEE